MTQFHMPSRLTCTINLHHNQHIFQGSLRSLILGVAMYYNPSKMDKFNTIRLARQLQTLKSVAPDYYLAYNKLYELVQQ